MTAKDNDEEQYADLTELFPLEPDSPDELADPIFYPFEDEYGEYSVDLKPYIHELYIVEKSLELTRVGDIVHPAQDAIIDKVNEAINTGKPCRIIVLKARQIGMSTIIEGILFALAFLLERLRGLVIAHEMGSSEHLLSMNQNYYDTFFAKDAYTQKNKSSKVLSWLETKSQIGISTARNMQSARGRTIHFLHGSEVGFWDNADILMTGLAQAIPMLPLTFVFLESTANGIGNYFHTTWEDACSGELDYTPMFFPWYTHPEYLASKLGIPLITDSLDKALRTQGHLDPEERKLVEVMRNPPKERWNDYTARSLDDQEIIDRLTWRRYAIRNLCKSDLNKFHQEYPTTPEEAFISTGTNIFPKGSLDLAFAPKIGKRGSIIREGDKVRFQANVEGKLTIFRQPGPGADYIVSGDPKRAVQGDYCCIQVLNRRTWEQVATYRAKDDPVSFGETLMNVGLYYNTALLVCEIEGGGSGTIAVVQDRNYPNIWQHEKAETMPGQVDNTYGWHTNWKTKNQAIGNLKKVVVDQLCTFHDRTTYNEMKHYVAMGNGKFGNGEEADHDDTVMAFAIGITVIFYTQHELLPVDVFKGDTPYAPKSRPVRVVEEELNDMKNQMQQAGVLKVDDTVGDEAGFANDVADQPAWMNWGNEGVVDE